MPNSPAPPPPAPAPQSSAAPSLLRNKLPESPSSSSLPAAHEPPASLHPQHFAASLFSRPRRPLPKQRRPHANPRRALCNRQRKVPAHPHRQHIQPQSRMRRRPPVPPLPQTAKASPRHILRHAPRRNRHQPTRLEIRQIRQPLQQLRRLQPTPAPAPPSSPPGSASPRSAPAAASPAFPAASFNRSASFNESTESIASNNSTARAALFDCKCPIK